MNFKKILICILPILVISILYIIKEFYQEFTADKFLPCWFNVVTGYLCPGCGGTRSFYALMNGDIVSSFKYNAFVPVMCIFGIIIYCRLFLKIVCNINIRVFPKNDDFVYIPLVIFLVYFLVRNFFI